MAAAHKPRNQFSGKLPRLIRVVDSLAYIPLTRGYEAVIDAADVYLIEAHNWMAKTQPSTTYAVTNVQKS